MENLSIFGVLRSCFIDFHINQSKIVPKQESFYLFVPLPQCPMAFMSVDAVEASTARSDDGAC